MPIAPIWPTAAWRGRVEAARYASTAALMQVVEPLAAGSQGAALRCHAAHPGADGRDACKLFDEEEGWAWVQLARDGYVGYVNGNALSPSVTRAHPSRRRACDLHVSGCQPQDPARHAPSRSTRRLCATGMEGKFPKLANGRFVYTASSEAGGCLRGRFRRRRRDVPPCALLLGRQVRAGSRLLRPRAARARGLRHACPRDSDMQEQTSARALLVNDLDGLRRGDLVFWNGHVGIMTDELDAAPCQWPSHDGRGRALARGRRPHCWSAMARSPALKRL